MHAYNITTLHKKDIKSIDITNPWGMTYVSNLQGTFIMRKKQSTKHLQYIICPIFKKCYPSSHLHFTLYVTFNNHRSDDLARHWYFFNEIDACPRSVWFPELVCSATYTLFIIMIFYLTEKHIIVPNAYESHITTTYILSKDSFRKLCWLIFSFVFIKG